VSILELFAKSPFKPMQEHMHSVMECVRQMEPLFDALCTGDRDALGRAERSIDELESKADKLKNDLRAHLPRRLFLPVDRRDLLEVLDQQDTIADCVQDIAELFVQRNMPIPSSMRSTVLDLVRGVIRTCECATGVIDMLDELVETGFRGREASRVEQMIERLGSLESETDRFEATLCRQLFELEESLSPVDVMLWYQLIGWIGDVADHAEKVGNRLRLLIAR